MLDRFRVYWLFIRTSLWFVPLLMSIAAIALGLFMTHRGSEPPDIPFLRPLLFNGDADSARSLLSALLSAMITMAALVVSITMVVLTLAAGQLGPRVIRSFMGDRAIQLVLGSFVATILYVLVVLRTLNEDTSFSNLAVTGATVFSGFCVFILLFFIHRLATLIMADTVVQRVTSSLFKSIDAILPQRPDPEDMTDRMETDTEAEWIELSAAGYIQAFEFDSIIAAAERKDAVVCLNVRPGHYLVPGVKHIGIVPRAACDAELTEAIRGAVLVGAERTPAQDLEYGVRQLVEIGLRALSPGINDPFTAIVVLDYLTGGLARMFQRSLEPRVRRDKQGKVRIVRVVSDWEGLVTAAFNQIRRSGRDIPAILIHMADNIASLAPTALSENQRQPLRAQLDAIEASAKGSDWIACDLAVLRTRVAEARRLLGQ